MTTFFPQITIGPITTNFAIQLLDNGQLRYEVVDFDLDYDTGEEGEVLFPDDCKRGSQPWALAQAFIDRLTERLERGFVVQMYEVGRPTADPRKAAGGTTTASHETTGSARRWRRPSRSRRSWRRSTTRTARRRRTSTLPSTSTKTPRAGPRPALTTANQPHRRLQHAQPSPYPTGVPRRPRRA